MIQVDISDPIDSFSGVWYFLSNFYVQASSSLRLDGGAYLSVEHAYQAAKTLNTHQRLLIQQAVLPGEARSIGQTVDLRPNWKLIRVNIMLGLLRQKFRPSSTLAKLLLGTSQRLLIEGNTWHDNFWGSCTCEHCQHKGDNVLGQLLMVIRDELRRDNL